MKVGEYARLNNTLYNTVVILKIMEVYDNTILTENNGSIFQGEYGKDEIIKHSYNIIDLIEVGDFITYRQGNIYWNIPERVSGRYNRQNEQTDLIANGTPLEHLEVLTIVTKEQFSSMEYKVK